MSDYTLEAAYDEGYADGSRWLALALAELCAARTDARKRPIQHYREPRVRLLRAVAAICDQYEANQRSTR